MVGYPDDDPMSLVHDRYSIAMKMEEGERKVGHVSKFMSKVTYYFIRHGRVVSGKVVGEREHSWDLEQGGLQITSLYTFSCADPRVLELFKTIVYFLILFYFFNGVDNSIKRYLRKIKNKLN